MRTKHAFRDMQPGDICTATISYFRMSIKRLMKRKLIAVESRGRHEEYVFLGFERQFDNDLPDGLD